jgi:TonB family protein
MLTRLSRRAALVAAACALVAGSACIDKGTAQKAVESITSGPPKPDVLPRMKNAEPPFHIPPALYEQKVQGNVVLRIYIDRMGNVHPDSTSVMTTSGYPGLDSAAIAGSRDLVFEPARLKGDSIPVLIQFPVFFRHPGAAPLPGDTILRGKRDAGSGKSQ